MHRIDISMTNPAHGRDMPFPAIRLTEASVKLSRTTSSWGAVTIGEAVAIVSALNHYIKRKLSIVTSIISPCLQPKLHTSYWTYFSNTRVSQSKEMLFSKEQPSSLFRPHRINKSNQWKKDELHSVLVSFWTWGSFTKLKDTSHVYSLKLKRVATIGQTW